MRHSNSKRPIQKNMKSQQQSNECTIEVQQLIQFKQQGDTSNPFNINQNSHNKAKPIQKMLKDKAKRAFKPLNQEKDCLLKPKLRTKDTDKPLKQTQKHIAPKIQPRILNEQETDDEQILNQPTIRTDIIEQYEDEIIQYLISEQKNYKVNGNYVKLYRDFNQKIRNHVVKYIFKIVQKYQCGRKTLFLAVFCLDYYLSKRESRQMDNQHQYVLTAQAALHIAMKHEEIYPPSLEKFTDSRQRKQILAQEAQILRTINFKLNLPSLVYFEEFLKDKFKHTQEYKANKQSCESKEMTVQMLCDLCLFDTSLYEEEPYVLAHNIRRLVYERLDLVPFKEQRIILSIKWAIERNPGAIKWLKQFKYPELQIQ